MSSMTRIAGIGVIGGTSNPAFKNSYWIQDADLLNVTGGMPVFIFLIKSIQFL